MNKRDAFKHARDVYPGCKPTRVSGFTLTPDSRGITIAGLDEDVVVVLHNKTDLFRLMAMCQLALANRKKTDQPRGKNSTPSTEEARS